jgi:uncharacterized protein YbjT (DUF2867 family)
VSVVAVVGGTGTLGRHIVASLRESGEEVRVLSRSSHEHPVDLTSGSGLDGALYGCEVVIDASNGSPRRPEPVIVEGTGRVAAAAARAGVGHYVCVSIVGIELVPSRYYRAKVAQENVVKRSGVPWAIVRSTQFHELVEIGIAALGRWRLSARSDARLQPVAAAEAAAAVAHEARRPASGQTTTVGGPEVLPVSELSRIWSEERGRGCLALPVPLPPKIGAPLKSGALTCAAPDIRGVVSFRAWLRDRSG